MADVFGEDFDNSYSDYSEANTEYQKAATELSNMESGTAAYKELEAKVEALKTVKVSKAAATFSNLAKDLGDSSGKAFDNLDVNKSLQSQLPENVFKNLDTKMKAGQNALIKQLSEITGTTVDVTTKLFDTKIDDNGNRVVSDDPVNKAKAKEVSDGLIKKWGMRVAALAFSMLVLAGAVAGAWEIIKNTLLCDLAKTQSGCFVIDPSTGKFDTVSMNAPADCSNYDHTCGGCNGGSLQSNIESECCNSATDQSASLHKGWQYTFKCESPSDALLDIVKSIGGLFDPSNLTKILMILLYVGLGILGVVIFFFLIKWLISRLGAKKNNETSKSETPKSETSKIEMPKSEMNTQPPQ